MRRRPVPRRKTDKASGLPSARRPTQRREHHVPTSTSRCSAVFVHCRRGHITGNASFTLHGCVKQPSRRYPFPMFPEQDSDSPHIRRSRDRNHGIRKTLTTDSNRRPPPYHGTTQAAGRNRQRFSLFDPFSRHCTGCDQLRAGLQRTPSSVVYLGYEGSAVRQAQHVLTTSRTRGCRRSRASRTPPH
jgi:hypothetical protein